MKEKHDTNHMQIHKFKNTWLLLYWFQLAWESFPYQILYILPTAKSKLKNTQKIIDEHKLNISGAHSHNIDLLWIFTFGEEGKVTALSWYVCSILFELQTNFLPEDSNYFHIHYSVAHSLRQIYFSVRPFFSSLRWTWVCVIFETHRLR